MTAVRDIRPVAIVLAFLLAIAMAVLGSASPSSAAAGEISGQVVDSTLTGLDGLTVIIDDGSDPPAYQTVHTSGGGYFTYSPPVDGDYDVVVLGGDDHLDYNSGPISYELATPSSGDLGQIVLDPGKRITGVVQDAATGSGVDGVVVLAIDPTFTDVYFALPPTDATGAYSLAVPPGGDYHLVAVDYDFFSGPGFGVVYDPQFWDHVNFSTLFYGCGCVSTPGDPISVSTTWPGAAITDIDFDLLSYSDWVYFSVWAEDLNGDEKPGLLVHLDRRTGPTTWDIDIDTELTDADGIADLFALGDGDYRLRYSVGGVYKAIDSWYEPIYFTTYPLYDGGKSVELDGLTTTTGCGCGPGGFTTLEVDLVFPVASGGGGGGGTPGTSGQPVAMTSATFALPTPAPAPTPTPTPTSSPSPSSSPEPSGTATPAPDPDTTADAGFPWWIILIIVLVLGIVITIIVMVRRR